MTPNPASAGTDRQIANAEAGAALGSVFGELADDVVAEQGNMIWQKLGSALFSRKRAHHEEDAGDCAGRRCRRPAESAQALRNRRL